MARQKTPVTQAIRELRQGKVEFTDHLYGYEEKGGTAVSARELGVDEHAVIKTLVMEDEQSNPIIVLMHGDREVSTKNLAREIGCRQVTPCDPATAQTLGVAVRTAAVATVAWPRSTSASVGAADSVRPAHFVKLHWASPSISRTEWPRSASAAPRL